MALMIEGIFAITIYSSILFWIAQSKLKRTMPKFMN